MTLYTAGIAKDCCDDSLNVYYDFDIEQRRNVKNNLYSEFTANITFDNGNQDPCVWAGEDYPNYFQNRTKQYWQAICNHSQTAKQVLEGGKTFKRTFLSNFGLGNFIGYAWVSQKVEMHNPAVIDPISFGLPNYYLHECGYQVRFVVVASPANPSGNGTAIWGIVTCSVSRDDQCFRYYANSPPETELCCPDPIIYAGLSRGPIAFTKKVYPEKILVRTTTTPKYLYNQETLYDCENKSIELNWNDEKALYVSDWQTCGNQPFRLIGYSPVFESVADHTLDAINCQMELKYVGPHLPGLFAQYPSYPYEGGYGNNHGAYNTAGVFDCGGFGNNCWQIEKAIDD